MKMYQSGYSNRFENELKFMKTTNTHDWGNMTSVRILSRLHKGIVDWNVGYRNKYASDRWINDSRGCGMGCLVAKRRFVY